jgi:hypothetical protein
MVNVDSIVTKYEPNLGVVIADPDFKRFAGSTGSSATVGSFQIPSAAGVMNPEDAAMEDPAMLGLTPTLPPQATAPPAAGAGPVVAAATSAHGFIVTINGTTPHSEPAAFLTDTVIKNLEAMALDKLPKDKTYYVAKAEIVTTTPLRSNAAKLAEMQRVFQAAEVAKGLPTQAQLQQQGLDAMTPEDAAANGVVPGQVPGQPAVGPNGQPLDDPRPYRDRLLGAEDVRDDSEFTIVFAIVLDATPPAAPAAEPNAPAPAAAPAAPTAAAR